MMRAMEKLTKKRWKSPVLHSLDIEKTLSGATDFQYEDSDYNPQSPSIS
jgi:hypothetical protein